MATYTIGSAVWTSGSHKVTFSALTNRPAVFLGCYDNNGAYLGYNITQSAYSAGFTSTTTLDDPTTTYTTYGTNQRLLTCNTASTANSITYTEQSTGGSFPYGDSTSYYTVTGGATKLSLLLWTVGNTIGNWVAVVTTGTGSFEVAIPTTPNSTWNELFLTLPSSATSHLANIKIKTSTGTYFNVGDQIALSQAYIANTDNKVIQLGDKISPDGGTTQYTVDKISNNANATGSLYVVYVKEASVTGGTFSTSRIEGVVPVARDFTATIAGVNTTQATLLNRIKTFGSTIAGASTVSSTLSGVIYKLFNSTITSLSSLGATQLGKAKLFASTIPAVSKVYPAFTIMPIYNIGNATWTNGSHIVDGTTLGTALNALVWNEPLTQTSASTNGLDYYGVGGLNPGAPTSQAWGTSGTYQNGIASSYYTYQTKNLPPSNNGAGDDVYTPEDGAVFKRHGSWGATATGYDSVLITLKFYNTVGFMSSGYQVSLSQETDTAINTSTNVSALTGFKSNAWSNVSVPLMPSTTLDGLAKVCFFKSGFGSYNNGLLIDSIMMYHSWLYAKTVKPFDYISPDGGSTQYKVLKVLQNSTGKPLFVLETAYIGSTGTQRVTLMTGLPHIERPFVASVDSLSTVSAQKLTRLQLLAASIVGSSVVQASGLFKAKLFTGIVDGASTITSNLGKLRKFGAQVIGQSNGTQRLNILKQMSTAIQGTASFTAVEFIRYRLMSAVSNATSSISSVLGKTMFFNGNLNATSNITSNTTRLQLFASTVTVQGLNIITGTLGYVKQLSTVLLQGSSLIESMFGVNRDLGSTVDGTSAIEASLIKSLSFGSTVEGNGDLNATPSFIIGLNASPIAGQTVFGNVDLNKFSLIQAAINGLGDVVTTGEFTPVSLFSASFSARGDVEVVKLSKDVVLDSQIISMSSINSSLNRLLMNGTSVDGLSTVKGWLDVPEALRQLLITSSGVVITNDEFGNIMFDVKENTTSIAIRSVSIVLLNDVYNNRYQTIVVVS